jgi:hypothetical protein
MCRFSSSLYFAWSPSEKPRCLGIDRLGIGIGADVAWSRRTIEPVEAAGLESELLRITSVSSFVSFASSCESQFQVSVYGGTEFA